MISCRGVRILIVSILLFSSATAYAQEASFSVGILPFMVNGKKDRMSDEAVSELSGVLGKYAFIKLIDRSKMDTLLNEIALSQTGIVSDETIINSGKVHGLQIIITGTISSGKISARVIHMESQRVLAAVSGRRIADAEEFGSMFARSIEVFLNQENIRHLSNENSSIGFKFWLSKNVNGKTVNVNSGDKIAIGESIVFNFTGSIDGYLTIIDIQPGGDIVVLYPNDYSGSNNVKAGVHYTVPSKDDGFEITVGEPCGSDVIKAFYTSKKVDWLDAGRLQGEGFLTIKPEQKADACRGIYITKTKMKRAEWATGLVEIEVVNKK